VVVVVVVVGVWGGVEGHVVILQRVGERGEGTKWEVERGGGGGEGGEGQSEKKMAIRARYSDSSVG